MIDSLRQRFGAAVGRVAPLAAAGARRLGDPEDERAPLLLWGAVATAAIAVALLSLRLAPDAAEIQAAPAVAPPETAFAALRPAAAEPEAAALRDLLDTYRTEAASLLRLATTLRQDNDMLRSRLLAVETEMAGLNANSILKGRIDRVEQGITGLREQTVAATARSEAALAAAAVDRVTTAAIPVRPAAAGDPPIAAAAAGPSAENPAAGGAAPIRSVGGPGTPPVLPVEPAVQPDGALDLALLAGGLPEGDDDLLPSPLPALQPGGEAAALPAPGIDANALGLEPNAARSTRTFTDPEGIVPLPAPRPANGVGRSQFGLDVGGAPDVASARLVWAGLTRTQGALLGRLQPVASARTEPDGSDRFRIVLGPFGDAADAAAACARLQAAGTACTPTLYAGEPLTP